MERKGQPMTEINPKAPRAKPYMILRASDNMVLARIIATKYSEHTPAQRDAMAAWGMFINAESDHQARFHVCALAKQQLDRKNARCVVIACEGSEVEHIDTMLRRAPNVVASTFSDKERQDMAHLMAIFQSETS